MEQNTPSQKIELSEGSSKFNFQYKKRLNDSKGIEQNKAATRLNILLLLSLCHLCSNLFSNSTGRDFRCSFESFDTYQKQLQLLLFGQIMLETEISNTRNITNSAIVDY